ARTGTILGVTRSDANPTYRRLEQYEPLLRLAVPAILGLFLLTLAASAWIQVRAGREDPLADAIADIDIVAPASAARPAAELAPADGNAAAAQLDRLVRAMPTSALAQGRTLVLADAGGKVLAIHPDSSERPATLLGMLGEGQPLTTFTDRAGVMTIRLPGG